MSTSTPPIARRKKQLRTTLDTPAMGTSSSLDDDADSPSQVPASDSRPLDPAAVCSEVDGLVELISEIEISEPAAAVGIEVDGLEKEFSKVEISEPQTNAREFYKNKLARLLNANRASPTAVATHTSLAEPRGSFALPLGSDAHASFLSIYAACLEAGVPLHLTEAHTAVGPMVVDIDLRHPAGTDSRRYTRDHVVEVTRCLLNCLYTFLCERYVQVVLLEKPCPRPDKRGNLIKDGWHLILPNVITPPSIPLAIRAEFLSHSCARASLEAIPGLIPEATADEMFDEAVIERNNWFMYGSKKPDEQHPWKVTAAWTFDLDKKTFDTEDLTRMPTEHLLTYLSIRRPADTRCSDLTRTGLDAVNAAAAAVAAGAAARPRSAAAAPGVLLDVDKFEEVTALVARLAVARADEYKPWTHVGWCLRNQEHSERMLELFKAFSARSLKYDEESCEDLWFKTRVRAADEKSLGFGSLVMWAKEDDPSPAPTTPTRRTRARGPAKPRTPTSAGGSKTRRAKDASSPDADAELASLAIVPVAVDGSAWEKHELSIDPAHVQALIKLLDDARAADLVTWRNVGIILHTLSTPDTNFFELWVDFSRRCPERFQESGGETGLADIWADMCMTNGLNIKSLERWAREDNTEEYRQLYTGLLSSAVMNCNGLPVMVARITSLIIGESWVCVSANGNEWYQFDGTLWQSREKPLVRKLLSSVLRDVFVKAAKRVSDSDAERGEWLMKIANACHQTAFKDSIMKELAEHMYDPYFVRQLDTSIDLLAFSNGVYDFREQRFRRVRAGEYLSASTGFPYIEAQDEVRAARVKRFWEEVHPDAEQRTYMLKTLARQLRGDSGKNLFHSHTGAGANGKTECFRILSLCGGDYIVYFEVDRILRDKAAPGAPQPELAEWRAARILWCSEPDEDKMLKSGTLKSHTGGEEVITRMLHSNIVIRFTPKFKSHMLSNDLPRVKGQDTGLGRRIRVVHWQSKFVAADEVDAAQHKYLSETDLLATFKEDPVLRMEMMRLLLKAYDAAWEFPATEAIKQASAQYMEDNNPLRKFLDEFVVKVEDLNAYFTVADAKRMIAGRREYLGLNLNRDSLEKAMGETAVKQKRVRGKAAPVKDVFFGYTLVDPAATREEEDPLELGA